MLLTPYYRSYQLTWESDPEEQRRFRIMLLAGIALVFPFMALMVKCMGLAPRWSRSAPDR